MKSGFFNSLKNELKDLGTSFIRGNWKTKLSFVVMGAGNLLYKQIVRGLTFLGFEVLFSAVRAACTGYRCCRHLVRPDPAKYTMLSTINTYTLTTTIHSRYFYTEF